MLSRFPKAQKYYQYPSTKICLSKVGINNGLTSCSHARELGLTTCLAKTSFILLSSRFCENDLEFIVTFFLKMQIIQPHQIYPFQPVARLWQQTFSSSFSWCMSCRENESYTHCDTAANIHHHHVPKSNIHLILQCMRWVMASVHLCCFMLNASFSPFQTLKVHCRYKDK